MGWINLSGALRLLYVVVFNMTEFLLKIQIICVKYSKMVEFLALDYQSIITLELCKTNPLLSKLN